MKFALKVNGVEELRRKVANVAECATAGTLTRRGLSAVGKIVTQSQKRMAPVRKPRVLRRKLRALQAKGVEIGKATKRASVVVKKFRRVEADFIGPRQLIKPGLVKRSIGYRVLKKDNAFIVKMGMNVGKKRSNKNFAPHASFVGSGTDQRYSFRPKAGQIGPNKINRGRMPPNRFIYDATNIVAVQAMKILEQHVQEDTVRAFKMSIRASRAGV
ncbi:MAG: hypothetical protein E6Q97_06465 [Desulfurellales bacterium]|nr:MAG: hypothetical protein E6Q97_06465 [Desulfurellales bacterium]